jgi:hypothetical protein
VPNQQLPASPYGYPFQNAAIPLKVAGRQLYFPRNLQQRLLPPNVFDQLLSQEDAVWDQILTYGGLTRLCPSEGTIYQDPPWTKMPALGRRFSKINSIPLPDNGSGEQLVTSMLVPLGWDGVIISTVNMFTGQNFLEGSGDITFRLKINDNRYVKDMGNLQTTLGTLTQPWPVNSGSIRLLSGQLVRWFVNVSLGSMAVNGRIIAAMFGWFWPR